MRLRQGNYKIIFAIIALIIISFAVATVMSMISINHLVDEDMEYTARILSSNVHNAINKDLSKPIYLSQMMANDYLLESWLKKDKDYSEYRGEKVVKYLKRLKETFKCDTIFVIDAKSGIYYTYTGVSKIVDKKNEHDRWYYTFLDKNMQQDIEMDADEVHGYRPTVFVDARITDDNENLIGVCGIGVNLDTVQATISEFEKIHNIKISLVDTREPLPAYKEVEGEMANEIVAELISDKLNLTPYVYKKVGNNGYIVVKYIENMGWHLILQRENDEASDIFREILIDNVGIVLIILVILLIATIILIKQERSILEKQANTDELTQAYNRKFFMSDENIESIPKDYVTMALLDVDNFKKVNDTLGHLKGDEVLIILVKKVKEQFGERGIVIRWGGDEFMILFDGDIEGIYERCELLRSAMEKTGFTISVGVSEIEHNESIEKNTAKVDKALYRAKEEGRNKVIIA